MSQSCAVPDPVTIQLQSRSNITTYGEATSDEMCYDFVVYYPRQASMDSCSSLGQAPSLARCVTDSRIQQWVEHLSNTTSMTMAEQQDLGVQDGILHTFDNVSASKFTRWRQSVPLACTGGGRGGVSGAGVGNGAAGQGGVAAVIPAAAEGVQRADRGTRYGPKASERRNAGRRAGGGARAWARWVLAVAAVTIWAGGLGG